MRNGNKSSDESLVGRRVKVSWPEQKVFTKGVVLLSHSGKNLVVCTDGVEDYLNGKKGNGEPVNDAFSSQAMEKCYPTHASSDTHPEQDAASKGYDGELVGCKVKVWRPKSSTFSEGFISSYNRSNKKHLVVYTDGDEEMLNLMHIETTKNIPADQAQTSHSPAREFTSMYSDDDMDAELHARKKQKGPSPDHTSFCGSPVLSNDLKTPKFEADVSPADSKSSSIIGDDLINVGGYKVKISASPILAAIFEKYGDIAARCRYRSKSVRASLLEVVCNVVQRLQHHDFDAILSDLDNLANEVSDIEASGIEVPWLNKYIDQLCKIVPFQEKYRELKKTKSSIGVLLQAASNELRERQAELLLAQERFNEASKRVKAVNLVARKIDDDMLESESEEFFWRRRLDDLP